MNTCTHHQNARAAWRCSKCGATLCPACAVTSEVSRTRIERCLHCGGIAQELMVEKEILPYWGMFGEFLKALFSIGGILQILVIGAMIYLTGLVPIIGWIFSLGLYAGYYFLVIARYAVGEVKLPMPLAFSDLWDDILGPFVRFVLATLILWVPAFLYIHGRIGFAQVFSDLGGALADPVLALIVILCMVYFPGAMIIAAVSQSTLSMLNPLIILGIIVRMPKEYLITVVVWGLLMVANAFLKGVVGEFLQAHNTFLISGILYEFAGLFLPLMTAMILGRLVYQNSELLGFAKPRDLLVPEFPNATPQGVEPAGGWDRPKPIEHPEAISLEPETAPSGFATETPGGMPVSSSDPATTSDPAATLETALQAGDNAKALVAFKQLTGVGEVPELVPALELRLANLLERSGQSLAAAHACRRAAEKDMSGPMAAQAIFTAGRLLVEKLGKREQGAAMYRYLVENFPTDPLSERAREMLKRLGGTA